RHPRLHARVRRFSAVHPRTWRLLRQTAKLAWWTLTLQLPARIKTRIELNKAGGLSADSPSYAVLKVALRHLVEHATPGDTGRRMICVSHVLPYPARAGNQYRIFRLLRWLSKHGWNVTLIVCPLPGAEPP